MRLCRFEDSGRITAGFYEDDRVIPFPDDAAGANDDADLLAYLPGGAAFDQARIVIGAACLVRPFVCSARVVTRDGMVMVAATVLFIAMALMGGIERWQGVILLATLFIYLGTSYRSESRHPKLDNPMAQEVEEIKGIPTHVGLAFSTVFLATIGLALGSRLLVSGGIDIATMFGVPPEVIGLTLIALGTSLPELATVIIAALRRHGDVAMGNVVGSNIFNLLAIGGGVALVEPIRVPAQILRFDLWVMLAVAGMMMLMLAGSRTTRRWQGALLTVVYLVYIGAQYGPLRYVFDI